MKSPFLSAIVILASFGCDSNRFEDPIGGDDDLGPADSLGGDCPFDGDDARGILELVNDGDVDVDELDDAIGLDSRAANGIVSTRPIASLSELAAVPYVGPTACDRLRSVACESRGLCEAELRMITWNVEHFPLTGETIDEVADAIGEIKPEIIGFQEVDDPDAFDRLEDKLPGYSGFVGEPGFGTRVAILYRRDRLRVTEIDDLYTNDSRAFPRPPLAVTFDLQGRAAKTALTFIIVHLKAGGDDDDKERRREAIVILDGWIKAHHTPSVFLVGDMNDQLDDSPSSNVFGPMLDTDDYSLPTLEVDDHSYIPFPRLIDHIVLSAAAESTFQTIDASAIPLDETILRYTSRVSDHRPVETVHIPRLPAL